MKHTLTSLVLGISLLFGSVGVGSAQDFLKGRENFNNFDALKKDFLKGFDALKKGDPETAVREWRPLAEQGYAPAQHLLGIAYRKGQGVVQDSEEAARWYLMSR